MLNFSLFILFLGCSTISTIEIDIKGGRIRGYNNNGGIKAATANVFKVK